MSKMKKTRKPGGGRKKLKPEYDAGKNLKDQISRVFQFSKQEEIKIDERYYFAVADRKLQKGVSLLDIVEPKQQVYMNEIVQKAYQDWLKQQTPEARQKAPKKLYWGQADWFFDSEGIGLHYRSLQIVEEGKQLDIYLSKAQTQQVLKADIYKNMF